jgi:hypothetical protein
MLIVAALLVQGQNFYESYKPVHYETADSGALNIHFYNNNFIKNNEYFGPYTEGMTYIGSILQPEVTWAISSKFNLSAGWYLRYYFGQDSFEKSLPVIKANYTFMPGAQLIMGQLNGQLEHGYIEPVYNTDNYFIKNPEYGVQFLLDRKRLHLDVFMDWEKFLLPGEDHQEEIAGGLLATYSFNELSENRGLSAYIQSIIHHFGGQVDISDSPMETRANASGGLEYTFVPGQKLLDRLTLASYYIQAFELSPTNTLPLESGFALQNTLTVENKWIKLSSGWFHGDNYFAPMGDYLFQSISQTDPEFVTEKRDLVVSKFLLRHQITKGVNLGFRFESYYDLQRKWNDFSYGLNISVNEKVFERKARGKRD